MRIGSLFSGIGGLELGLERAGLGETVWQCEINPYARRVLAKHWPGVTMYEDIRDIDESAEPVDLICGGFPCQDISVAGKQAGIHAAKSGLFFDLMRVVRMVGPRFVLLENVPALLSGDRGRWFGAVLGELAESGFDAEWDCIPAQAVGAPHRRDRVFVIAVADATGEQGRRIQQRGLPADAGAGGEDVAHANGHHRQRGSGDVQMGRKRVSKEAPHDGLTGGTQWAAEPNVGRVANGVPSRVDRLRCLGNAVVPQVAEHIGRLIQERM